MLKNKMFKTYIDRTKFYRRRRQCRCFVLGGEDSESVARFSVCPSDVLKNEWSNEEFMLNDH